MGLSVGLFVLQQRGTPDDDGIVFIVAVAVAVVVAVVVVLDDGHVRHQPACRIRRDDAVQLRGGRRRLG